MAELVAAVGVPHSPHYPSQYPEGRAAGHAADSIREVKAHLDAVKADAIVVIANDHFNTFFLNNFPTFAIGVADAAFGPNDQTKMPHYDFAVQSSLASHMLKTGMDEGFDFSVTQEFGVDHAMLVPLHYLTDDVKTPVVPIWVNTFVKPAADRAPLLRARQDAARRDREPAADDARRGDRRPAASRSRSAGPKIDPGKRNSVPDIEWSKHLHRRIGKARVRRDRRGGDAGADVEGRQYRRRAAQLDRAARHGRQGQAALPRRPRRQGRPRLCGLAVELRSMSAYQINKLCHRVYHDIAFREAVKADPADGDRGLAVHRRGAQGAARRRRQAALRMGHAPVPARAFHALGPVRRSRPRSMPSASRAPRIRNSIRNNEWKDQTWLRSISLALPPITSAAIPPCGRRCSRPIRRRNSTRPATASARTRRSRS